MEPHFPSPNRYNTNYRAEFCCQDVRKQATQAKTRGHVCSPPASSAEPSVRKSVLFQPTIDCRWAQRPLSPNSCQEPPAPRSASSHPPLPIYSPHARLLFVYACVLGHFSHVQLCVILWAVVCQAPLSMRFSRQEYWRGLPCPPSGDLPNPGIEPASLMSPALAGILYH